MSRPSALIDMSPSCKAALFAYVRSGAPLEVACRVVGISAQTLRNWRARGNAELREEPFATFTEEIEQAEALVEVEAVIMIDRIVHGMRAPADKDGTAATRFEQAPDWRAIAWWLSRRFPKRWGAQVRIEHCPGALEQHRQGAT